MLRKQLDALLQCNVIRSQWGRGHCYLPTHVSYIRNTVACETVRRQAHVLKVVSIDFSIVYVKN